MHQKDSDLTIADWDFIDRLAESLAEQTIQQIAQRCIDIESDPEYPIDRCGQCQYFVSTPSDLPTGTCARHLNADVVLTQDVACLTFQVAIGRGGAA